MANFYFWNPETKEVITSEENWWSTAVKSCVPDGGRYFTIDLRKQVTITEERIGVSSHMNQMAKWTSCENGAEDLPTEFRATLLLLGVNI